MKRVNQILACPVMVLSGLGVFCSFVFTAVSLAGYSAVEKLGPRLLFPGIFIVWLPTIFFMNALTADFKQKDLWKAALRACPRWMRATAWSIFGLVFVGFFLPFVWGGKPGSSGENFLLFPSTFYAISFCVAYSTIHVDKFDAGRRCLNGHQISPLAKFCEECGAQAAPETMEQPHDRS
jgi:hypothetical protein